MDPRSLFQSRISIVIPCFNEQEVLQLLFDRVSAAANSWGANYEVILVDDGSNDDTWDLIFECNHRDPRWKGVRLARNFGHQSALWTGLNHATGDVIAIFDADLQDPPEILPRFFEKWSEGFDVVYAVRRGRKESWLKRAAYFTYYRLLACVSEIKLPLDSGDFCVLDRRALDAMLKSNEQTPFVRGLRAWVGFRQTGVEYERESRAAGQAKYTVRKLFQLAASGIFGFSTKPLRLATYCGLIVTLCALTGTMFALTEWLFGSPMAVSGATAIVLAILFLGGVQLLCLGILGEYVGRIYQNVKGRPLSVVGESVGMEEQTKLRTIKAA